jgi:hypothetical protein
MLIPRPEFFPSRIRIKEFRYFNPKKWFPSSRKYDLGCSFQIRIPDPDSDFLPIPDPRVKKAPDPGSGSARLFRLPTSFLSNLFANNVEVAMLKRKLTRICRPLHFFYLSRRPFFSLVAKYRIIITKLLSHWLTILFCMCLDGPYYQ